MNVISSPCIGDCKLIDYRLCRGCGRTSEEISQWLSYSEHQRVDIMEKCQQRLLDNQQERVALK